MNINDGITVVLNILTAILLLIVVLVVIICVNLGQHNDIVCAKHNFTASTSPPMGVSVQDGFVYCYTTIPVCEHGLCKDYRFEEAVKDE